MRKMHDDKLGATSRDGSHPNEEASLCIYFAKGSCNMGNNCAFSHSLEAKRPICKFFLSLQVLCTVTLISFSIFKSLFFG